MQAAPDDVKDVGLNQKLAEYLGGLAARLGRNPRILLVGNYGHGNLGDEAILAGLLPMLRRGAEVTVLSHRPERVTGARSVRTGSVASIRAAVRSDVLAIGGGGIFGNGMTLLPRLLPLAAVALRLVGVRTVFVAVGAYTTTPPLVKLTLTALARLSDLVLVRDSESAAVLGPASQLVRDPGMSLAPAPPADVAAAMARAQVPGSARVLAVSLKPASLRNLDDVQVRIAVEVCRRWLRSPDGHVLFLGMSERGDFGLSDAATDLTLAITVADLLETEGRVSFLGPDIGPAVMRGVLGSVAAALAHRLHAQMFAHAAGTPMIGMSYERKSHEFLKSIGGTMFDLEQLSVLDVRSHVERAWPALTSV